MRYVTPLLVLTAVVRKRCGQRGGDAMPHVVFLERAVELSTADYKTQILHRLAHDHLD